MDISHKLFFSVTVTSNTGFFGSVEPSELVSSKVQVAFILSSIRWAQHVSEFDANTATIKIFLNNILLSEIPN